MPNRFCAICGKPIDLQTFKRLGMCLNCYLKENPLFELPEKFTFKRCVECGAFSKKEEWILSSQTDIIESTIEALERYLLKPYLKNEEIEFIYSVDEESFDYSSRHLIKAFNMIVVGVSKAEKNVSHEEKIRIIINNDICINCSNLVGGMHFLSILQLRVINEKYFELVNDVLEDLHEYVVRTFDEDPRQYISKMEDQKFGVDLYLSTNELLNHVISYLKNRYHFLFKRSKKLVGRDNQRGKNIYRLKALIKFLPFKKKDVIIINGKRYKVEGIFKNRISLRGEDGSKRIENYSFFFNERMKILSEEEV